MTDQERQLLEELAGRIEKAPASPTDRDADELIRRRIGARPDALYILTQTVLIQEIALNQAKQQIDELKRQQPAGSFLGNASSAAPPPGGTGFGRSAGGDARPPQPSGYRASTYQTGYTPPPPAATPPPLPQYAAPEQYGPPQPSGFSGFLHNAAQTAAGVVAGEVAFSALSSLFGHHGGYYGGSGFLGGGGGNVISPVSETIINNNYYDEDRGGERRRFDSDSPADRSGSDLYVPDHSGPERFSAGDQDDDDTRDGARDDNQGDLADDSGDMPDDADDGSSYDDGSDSTDV
jgi:hypothetical protein